MPWSRADWAGTSRSPANLRTCTSVCRPRACWRCGSSCTDASAHSSTPWLGDNAVLKAVDVFRAIESLPFSRESSEMFDRPSINLGRIAGGDVLNKVPDRCEMAVDVRYLPGQDPGEILSQVRAIGAIDVTRTFIHPPVTVSRIKLLRAGAARCRLAGHQRRGDERGARRRVGRRVLHRGRHPGRRVRAQGRRPPRPRRVGLGVLAAALPPARWRTSCAPCPSGWPSCRAARRARCARSTEARRDPAQPPRDGVALRAGRGAPGHRRRRGDDRGGGPAPGQETSASSSR